MGQSFWVNALIWLTKNLGYCNYLGQQKINGQKNCPKKYIGSMLRFGQQKYKGQRNILGQCKNVRPQKLKV